MFLKNPFILFIDSFNICFKTQNKIYFFRAENFRM